jgi:ribosomal protein L17
MVASHIGLRGRIYRLRSRIPTHVRERIERREITRSLRTGDLALTRFFMARYLIETYYMSQYCESRQKRMPKVISSEELDRLFDIISSHPEGLGIEAIIPEWGASLSRRSMQRRLAQLIEQGRIVAEGEARATRYRQRVDAVVPVAGLSLATQAGNVGASAYVPTSSEGAVVREYVSRPNQERRPVGYQIEFLESYAPNRTYYLDVGLRDQLHAIGGSSAEQAPAGTFARDILDRLLIDLSWASSRLEGNTYSRLDTERLIEFGHEAEGKDAREAQMILNHKAAIEYLVNDPRHAAVTSETIIALHALLSDGLLPDPAAGGRVRRRAVEISGSVYRPVALPQRLEELFGIIVAMAAEIEDPFEQAFFLMVHLPYLQPFEDVNKRVSRVAANIPFIRHNLSPLSFIDVPQQAYVDAVMGVYELNSVDLLRDVFVWAYERSCQQYVAVRQQLAPVDTFRLRYRNELAEALRGIVRGMGTASDEAVQRVMPASVARGDRGRFIALVRRELASLHEGNAVRFGISPLELQAWHSLLKG